jgi:hypothetical protein
MPEEKKSTTDNWGGLIVTALTLLVLSAVVAMGLKALYGLWVSGYPFLALWLGLFTVMFVNDIAGR